VTDDEMKVTDRRMFTPDGELREEYRHLEHAAEARAATSETTPEVEPGSGGGTPGPTEAVEAGAEERSKRRPADIPLGDAGKSGLGFLDLVGLVAQPAAIYLGEARLPGEESAENLELARLHIDLLEVLKTKTAGNLSAQEQAFLEDLLYQLRLRYVQKRG
jgi:hypothetical protein